MSELWCWAGQHGLLHWTAGSGYWAAKDTHETPCPPPLPSCHHRLQHSGQSDAAEVDRQMSTIDAQAAALDLAIREKEDEVTGLQTEKELQSGGEVRELAQQADEISKR